MGQRRGLVGGDERGFMMAALLVSMSVMAVLMAVLLPAWSTEARRERETELVFRGEQYARAIGLFQRKYANARPPSIDVLLNERFLRKKYKDPITGEDFELLQTGAGPPAPSGPGQGAAQQGAAGRTGGASAQAQQPAGRQGGQSGGVGGQAAGSAAQLAQAGAGQGGGAGPGLVGVVSKSKEPSLRIYNGQQRYGDWVFMPVQMTTQAGGVAGAQAPGGRGGNQPGGQPGGAPGGLGGPGLPPSRDGGTGRRNQPPPSSGRPGAPPPQTGPPGFGSFGRQ